MCTDEAKCPVWRRSLLAGQRARPRVRLHRVRFGVKIKQCGGARGKGRAACTVSGWYRTSQLADTGSGKGCIERPPAAFISQLFFGPGPGRLAQCSGSRVLWKKVGRPARLQPSRPAMCSMWVVLGHTGQRRVSGRGRLLPRAAGSLVAHEPPFRILHCASYLRVPSQPGRSLQLRTAASRQAGVVTAGPLPPAAPRPAALQPGGGSTPWPLSRTYLPTNLRQTAACPRLGSCGLSGNTGRVPGCARLQRPPFSNSPAALSSHAGRSRKATLALPTLAPGRLRGRRLTTDHSLETAGT